MATYSSAPENEIVTFTKSVNNPGNDYQTTTFDLVTVPENTIYQPLNIFVSADSGGAGFSTLGLIEDGYISVSGLSNTGDNNTYNIISWYHNYYYISQPSGYIENGATPSNNGASWSNFIQIQQNREEYYYRYYPGTKIQLRIATYEHDVSGEQAAAKIMFLKTTFP